MKHTSLAGWRSVALGEVCAIINGGTPKSQVKAYWDGEVQWLTPKDMGQMQGREIGETPRTITQAGLDNSSARLVPPQSVILSTRAPIGHLAVNTVSMAFNQGCRGLVPSDALDHLYLYHFLSASKELLQSLGTGTTFKELSSGNLKQVQIPLPPLEEQRRVVAILDEAFEGLACARTNAEANLQNARELFESLRFAMLSERTEGWEIRQLADCFRLKSGENLTAKEMVPGPFPVYGGNGIAGTHQESNLSGDNVIIGRVGALCGNARYIDHDIWLTDNAFKIVGYNFDFDYKFLAYLLNFKNLRSLARQSAQPVISNSSLANLELIFPPSVSTQAELANKLAIAEEALDIVRRDYEGKIQDLDDLRQSILQKAFAGELR
ncbi:restriction endonuclease subunit S [Oceanibaculum indicum]|uniref:Type I restriction enzyme S subunit n=1 Tax=Oceanibaculum indicum TaxID=526216 RepID=A0A420WH76_9PROT|nr:restriction endonuclease subunit S [Oceanibaculum indicum]RKQ70360.1 type I restriction enzyme S subunit [Oceanibaculum indicum]